VATAERHHPAVLRPPVRVLIGCLHARYSRPRSRCET
jgi:hypothetical protein